MFNSIFSLYIHTLSNYECVKVKWSKITSQFFLSSKSVLWQYKNLAQIICFNLEIRASWLLFYSYVLAGLLLLVCSTQSFILYTHTLSNYECVKVKWSKITSQFFLSSKSVLWQYKNLAQIICFNLEIRASWLLFYSYVLAELLLLVCSTQSLACTLILCQTTSVLKSNDPKLHLNFSWALKACCDSTRILLRSSASTWKLGQVDFSFIPMSLLGY